MAIKYPDRIESNNPLAYGIVKATEIAGQRLVEQLSDLYKLSDAILSESKTGEDAEGLIWIVGKDLYQLISWENRNNASGWLKVIPFNEKMFYRFYNLDGNMINSLTGYTKAKELLNLLENDSLLNALGKLEYKSDLTYDLVNSVYEGVHTIEELREMLKVLDGIQNSSEILNNYLSKYLLLAGGTMTGVLDVSSSGFRVAADSGLTSNDRSIPYSSESDSSIIKWYNTGLTYNPASGALKAGSFVKRGGTSSQFLKADGSVDSTSYQSVINDLTTIRTNATNGNTAYGWGNHADAGYAKLNEEGQVERAIIADDLGGRLETREEQFIYQSTANDESVKDGLAIIKSIKGNTVVWNQLFKLYFTDIQDFWCVSRSSGKNFPINHKIFVKFKVDILKVFDQDIRVGLSNGGNFYSSTASISSLNGNAGTVKVILISNNSLNKDVLIYSPSHDTSVGENIIIDSNSINTFDLTQMFGKGNEPTSVEEFEKLYSHLPADYNEGSLLNLNADSIKSVGFNQWDEEWEVGQYSPSTGGFGSLDNTKAIRSKNYIQVIPGEKYYFKCPVPIVCNAYDENKEFIKFIIYEPVNKVITIPNDAHYIRFCTFSIDYGTTYNNDICINLSHNEERDGEYQSYEEHIVNLPIKKYFPDGMKSAGTAYDEIVFDKNIGKYKAIQRIGSVDMGTLRWVFNSLYGGFVAERIFPSITGGINKVFIGITAKYPYNGEYKLIQDKELGYIFYGQPFIKDSSFTDTASFIQSLAGQILYYELAEPIETIIDDYDLIDYEVFDFGTEEILSNESTTPIVADIQYGFNAVDEIRNHRFEIKKLNKKIDELTALVENLLTTLNVNYEEIEN